MLKRQRLMSGLKREKGMISIFLSGVLLLTSMASAILMDYGRSEVARAELKSGLRQASHTILAGFDKKPAYEFGVYALADPSEMEADAFRQLKERWCDHDGFRFVRPVPLSLQVECLPRAHLSNPEVLQTQVNRFMSWQIARLAGEKIAQQLKLLQALGAAAEPLKAKINFETQMKVVQEGMNQIASVIKTIRSLPQPSGIALPERSAALRAKTGTTDSVFCGSPDLDFAVAALQERSDRLDQSMAEAIAAATSEQGELPPSTEERLKLLSVSDRLRLHQEFDALKHHHLQIKNWLAQFGKHNQQLSRNIAASLEKIGELRSAGESWKGAIDAMPASGLALNLMGDYAAETLFSQPVGWEPFKKELDALFQQLEGTTKAWDEMKMDGDSLASLSFDQWLTKKLSQVERASEKEYLIPSSRLTHGKPEGWNGHRLSDESVRVEMDLQRQAEQDRSGLFETLRAWNTRRKAVANARRAARFGLPQLKGGIGDWIAPDAMRRYEEDASQMPGHSNVHAEAGEDQAMLSQLMQSFSGAVGELRDVSWDRAPDSVSLMTYWMGMFSHRVTPIMDRQQGTPRRSLTGLPLAERPIYGGELEYILHGRPLWMDNLRETEWRIAGLRLMANAVFAFTSSTLHAETAKVALAFSGWTGFAVPFIQSALLALLAIGETTLDMDALTAGERVPAMKTEETWRFSLEGIRNLGQRAGHDLFAVAEDEVSSGVEAAGEQIQGAVQNMGNAATEWIRDTVTHPVMRIAEQILLHPGLMDQKEISHQLKSALSVLANTGVSGQLDEASRGIFSKLAAKSEELAILLGHSREEKEASGQETNQVIADLEAKVNAVIRQVVGNIETVSSSATQNLLDNLHGLSASEERKSDQKLNEWLDQFQNDLSQGSSSGQVITGSGFELNYQDYILLLLTLYGTGSDGRSAMLSHTAQLIQAETGSVDLTLAPTELTWDLEASIAMPFLPFKQRYFSSGSESHLRLLKEHWEEGYGNRKNTRSEGKGGS